MRLESGPATGDRNYYAILTLFFAAFLLWFVYDGAVGYPSKNVKEARKKLAQYPIPADVVANLEQDETPTEPVFVALKKAAPPTLRDTRQVLGQPDKSSSEDGVTTDYYVSKYGLGTVQSRNEAVTSVDWQTWYKSKDDIKSQYWFAGICGVLTLIPLYRLIRAMMVRASIDDVGMTYCGRQIPFAAMNDLRDYNRKGWVDLYYDDGGRERRLRLDNVKVAKFDEIVDTLCEEKGFPDPRKKVATAEDVESA